MNPGMSKLPIRRKAAFTPERKPHKFPIFMFFVFLRDLSRLVFSLHVEKSSDVQDAFSQESIDRPQRPASQHAIKKKNNKIKNK